MSTPAREVRKTVTVLFCDLVHSTRLAEGDPEAYRRIQARYFDRMRRIVERHGGTVEKFVGDEVMAVFGVPIVHEDDALRAVRTGKEMLEELESLNAELGSGRRLEARIGINTGEVVAGDSAEGHAFVAGEPVIVAKRLEQAADPGEILIGRETYRLVEHAVEAGPLERIPVKGKEAGVAKRRLEEVDLEAPAVARRLHAPLVGRDDELQLLQQAFERTVEDRCCRLFTVLGSAGIGKSRLAMELLTRVDGRAVTAVGRCLSYGEGITFWPLAEALRGLGGEPALRKALADDEQGETILPLLQAVTGGADTASTEQIFWAVRRAFEALSRRRPLVVCFEDVHWAEPTMLDLVEYVVGWSRGAPILIVALSRPELIEQRPQWIAPSLNHDSLALEPLDPEATKTLLEGVSGDADLPARAAEAIVGAAEGNPLFAEQLAAMAAEGDGTLAIPPSIQAVLAERLDRLTPEEREVIERASIVGRDFPLAALASFFREERRFLVTQQLFSLVRKGLIRPDLVPSAAEDRFSFEHVLVRDAAYDSMPKELRAELNEHFADWLEGKGRRNEFEELIGYHLEEAHRNRLELGSVDDGTKHLALRASDVLASAGARALGRNDVHAARKLLGRAVGLRPDDDPAVAPRLDMAQALFLSGDLGEAAELASETEIRASAVGDEVGMLRARLAHTRIAAQAPPGDSDGARPSAELLAVAEEARPVFTRMGNDDALAEAWLATAWAQLIRCQCGAMLEAVERALEHVRRAGSVRWERELPVWKGSALFYGPTPVDDVLSWYEQQEIQHPVSLTQQGILEAMRGNFEKARSLAHSADGAAEEFGHTLWLAAGGMAVWEIEMLADDPAAAEAAARRSCDLLEDLGESGHRSNASGQLATSLYALGRFDEASKWASAAEALSTSDDVTSQVLWRQVRAQLLARGGERAEAERIAAEAVALVEGTDMLNWRGLALAALAESHVLAGRVDDARDPLAQALELYGRKGNRVAAAKARARLDELAARSPMS
jgi:class 3 adenylate cyclase/tetratricopeptide (TPR) repeat protein